MIDDYNMTIEQLSEKHLEILGAFCCTEDRSELADYKSDDRRRIIKHSKEMEDFLRNEALEEQSKNLNTTHLFINRDNGDLIGYISLCNDSIRLEFEERNSEGLTYGSAPAVKIARLAIDNRYKGQGYSRLLIDYAMFSAVQIREKSGVAFVTLDCYSHRQEFYEHIGFIKNVIQPEQRNYDTPISMRINIDTYLEKYDDENNT